MAKQDDKPTTDEAEQVVPEENVGESSEATEAPKEELKPESEVETSEPETPATETETADKEEPTPPAANARNAKRLEKLESLVSRLKGDEPTQAQPETPGTLDYGSSLDAAPEVIQQLEADRKAATATSYQQGIDQAKSIQFHTRLEIDAPKVESKYPIFNNESEDFKPEAANAINSWYLASVGYDAATDTVKNPNIRYADFVEGIMELADNMAGVKVEKTQTNIAKQAASTGLRPDGSTTKLNLNKDPSKMTDEELKAVLAQAGM